MNSWKKLQSLKSRKPNRNFTRAGDVAKTLFPQVENDRNNRGEVANFTYGNVWSRIWQNVAADGTIYFRISLNRIDIKNGNSIVRNNFTPDDLTDVMRAARRCQMWFNEFDK